MSLVIFRPPHRRHCYYYYCYCYYNLHRWKKTRPHKRLRPSSSSPEFALPTRPQSRGIDQTNFVSFRFVSPSIRRGAICNNNIYSSRLFLSIFYNNNNNNNSNKISFDLKFPKIKSVLKLGENFRNFDRAEKT